MLCWLAQPLQNDQDALGISVGPRGSSRYTCDSELCGLQTILIIYLYTFGSYEKEVALCWERTLGHYLYHVGQQCFMKNHLSNNYIFPSSTFPMIGIKSYLHMVLEGHWVTHFIIRNLRRKTL